ncbi:hypothetical protein Q4Q49_22075 [Shewanella sp. SP1S1-7]|jgi:hypothetical protein|uniref:hypothetical protein n=1 Tax=Shewanella TaxID=22 RepID=UPI00014F8D19|nr:MULTISPECIES: hypothetical protein [Shewanella]ABS06893.1 conserved hypothetical protein [Shewanella baltica OS185]MCS6240292.1 hypothetical protein [Shewanella baltica]MDT3337948.1 hypothetical protein [Shewanella sp. SP1S1-7]
MSDWPFDQIETCVAVTNKDIIHEGAPILHVCHDEEDHGWQFIGLDDAEEENIALVCMAEIVKLDPTVKEVAHIPPGWHAWRQHVGAEWEIEEYAE